MAVGILGLLAVAAVVAGLLTLDGTGGGKQPEAATVFPVTGVTSYDPFSSDKAEHSEDAPKITDGNEGTYWTTQQYNDAPSLDKPGVGVVVDAGKVVQLSRIVLDTDTPGFTAEIEATNVEGGTPTPVSATTTVGRRTSFELHPTAPMRYYVIWITKLPPGLDHAHVNEVRAFKN